MSAALTPSKHNALPWLLGLLVTLGLVLVLPPPQAARGLSGYLPLHSALEISAIAIAAMVFGVSWAAQRFRANARATLLGACFLGVALLDLGHVLSYDGMPDLITPNNPEKGIAFWLAARALAALGLLLAAFWPGADLRFPIGSRRLLLAAVLGLSLLVFYLVVFQQHRLPSTFVSGSGLTAFKIGAEYALIAAYALAAYGFSRRPQSDGELGLRKLALAAATMAMSEFFFTLYGSVTDVYNLVGHAYKVLAYGFVYQGLFVAVIQKPYVDLLAARAQQAATLDTLPDLLFEIDAEGTYLDVHANEPAKLAAPADALVGRRIAEVLPAAAVAICFEAVAEAARTGISRGKRFELAVNEGLRVFELSVAEKKQPGGRPSTYLMLSRDVTDTVKAAQLMLRDSRLNAAVLALRELSAKAKIQAVLEGAAEHAQALTCSRLAAVFRLGDTDGSLEQIAGRSALPAGILDAAQHHRERCLRPLALELAAGGSGGACERIASAPTPKTSESRLLLVVADKAAAYTADDLDVLLRLAETLWQITTQMRQLDEIKRLSMALDQSPHPVLITDPQVRIQYVNAAFTAVSGYEASEVLGRDPRMLGSGQTPAETYAELWSRLHSGQAWQGEFINRRKDGRIYIESALLYPILDGHGRASHYVAHKEDVTEARATRARIQALSDFDPLTGLLNKKSFDERLQTLLATADGARSRTALLWIDLDNFKAINETLGHPAGDELLVEMANRLRASLGPEVPLARFSGDAFIAALAEAEQASVALSAREALSALQQPCSVQGNRVALNASAGIALYPDDAGTLDGLSSAAEIAMYEVKQAGRNGLRFFSPSMQESSKRSLELAADLMDALDRGELLLLYQPQRCLRSGRLTGAEALLRWRHPKWGLVSPSEFIPIAEQTGAINTIGLWVFRESARQISAWRKRGLPELRLAVNVSAVQFARPEWLDELQDALQHWELPRHCIEIELTEAVALKNPEAAAATIDRLHQAGFRVALDDFGTGFSSLSYLQRYAIDKLKIDQFFVRGLDQNTSNREIVTAVIRMGHGLKMEIIAEGVETAAEMQLLNELGCDEIQGYGYSKPLEPSAFETFARAVSRA
ncbi:bifunctional diguanylate cyclase/phosphodiesterase [Aquimonas voraii]|uniref:cyclic-guanylate-specific phosphodiesterase n=1 Tax=Aquimonas voraii TaxID=265719 RepID=A0A1G6SCS0_9GAMM|nr:EAL domain-containing protein [Aquimonas voraii]SDD13905.1 PAS domain S-box-containing protein/diguanylate cyclase (GGDEF) domain-containing protein [Aquimonas voraii]